ncbi:MAG: MEDS domain-containing protein [Nitrospira sp. BO4]|nr:MEDS domain-containing protein [Nitrospira sp. BO4]
MPASGIRGTHDIPLGSHLCLFYRRPQDFLHVTASFLKAGLADHELCVWIIPPPMSILVALDELSNHGLNGPALQATTQLQISSTGDWYGDSAFDIDHSLKRLAALPPRASQLGYAGVRVVGGPGPFTSIELRQAFMRYEHQASTLIAASPMIALCCYASIQSLETDMIDIMRAHPQALVRTQAGWASI